MMTIVALRLCVLTAAFAGPAVPSFAEVVWSADSAQSTVRLTVAHLMIAKITGNIPIAAATIVTNEGSVVPLWVNATLDAERLGTRDQRRDAELRGERFFDVARFRTITFTSERVTATGPDSFAVDGALSMRGVTRPLRLEGHADLRVDPNGRRRAWYEATGRFRRSDYGMTFARGIVGNDVTLTITIEAVRTPP